MPFESRLLAFAHCHLSNLRAPRSQWPMLSGMLLMVLMTALPASAEWEIPESWIAAREPVHIASQISGEPAANLYYVGTAGLASYLITSEKGHILIDATLGENVDQVLGNVVKLGFKVEDIKILLASHAHFDHVGGMAEVKRRTGAALWVSAIDAEQMARGGKGDFFLGDTAPFEPVEADKILDDGDVVTLGGASLTARLTPGHTQGCTSWQLDVGKGETSETAVIICSLSVLDGYRLWKDPHYEGLGRDFCNSVAALEAIDADYFLASHPSFFHLDDKVERQKQSEKAFVDRPGYAKYLANARAKIEKTLADEGLEGGCSKL